MCYNSTNNNSVLYSEVMRTTEYVAILLSTYISVLYTEVMSAAEYRKQSVLYLEVKSTTEYVTVEQVQKTKCTLSWSKKYNWVRYNSTKYR